MVVFVGALKWGLPSAWPLSLRFGLEVLAGASSYVLVITTFHGDRLRTFISLVWRLRN